jgi:uncharacterized protein YraI
MRTQGCLRLLLGVQLLALCAAAVAQNAVTTEPVSVYAGPDDSYPMVAQLDADSPVQVMGCLDDWSWCDVAFADNRGWVYAPNVTYQYDGGYVPLYTYAPSLGIPVVQFTIGDYWGQHYHGRPWYAQRDEWLHREPPHHHRPPGPPPSAGPPPRSARVERSPHETQPERPLRLGSSETPRREAERHDGAGNARPPEPRDVRPPEPRDARAPESHDARAPETRNARAPEPRTASPPHEERPSPQARGEPSRHEERAPPPHQAEGARPPEPRRTEKPADRPGERPNDSPH